MKITRHLSDYYNHERQSDTTVPANKNKLRKVFVLEYCEDADKLERIDLIGPKGLDYDEVFDTIRFEELPTDRCCGDAFDGIAYERFLEYMFSSKVIAVKLFEEIWDGDELLQERYIGFPATFYHEFSKRVARDVMESRDSLRKQVDALQKEIDLMRGFIEKYNVKRTFEEYRQETA